MMAATVVRCEGTSKQYGHHHALNNLDIAIPRGGIVGILGPNGAGKSTLFRLIMGLIHADSGEVAVLNRKPGWRTNRDIAYLPDKAGWYPHHTVAQALKWGNDFLPQFDQVLAHEFAEVMAIELNVRAAHMSEGQRSRLMLLMCLARRVPLIILDEPFAGIDLLSKDRIIAGLIDHISERREQTILISTHDIYGAESLFDHVIFLEQGKVKLSGEVDKLRREHGSMETIFRTLY